MSRDRALFELGRHRVHDHAHLHTPGLTIDTPTESWAYGVSFIPDPEHADAKTAWTIELSVNVVRGQIGIGILTADGSSFIKEAVVAHSDDPVQVRLRVPAGRSPGPLVVRNAGSTGATVTVLSIDCRAEAFLPYLVDVTARSVRNEARPIDGGKVVFDEPAATAINRARLDWLTSLGLEFRGCRVLDVGAGVGHFSRYYTDRGATVVAVEGREENVAALRERCPSVPAYVADIQTADLTEIGQFQVVHCFGLLYHLDSPVIALRRMHDVCEDVLLLETMICDSSKPLMKLEDESAAVNQALAGLGCRPTPTFVVTALNRVGFRFIYGTTRPPVHPDFIFEWRDNGDTHRNGHNLRCMFIASRKPIEATHLIQLL